MENVTSLEGPVLKVNGELLLLIPLSDRGTDVAELSHSTSESRSEFLRIVIPAWLAGILDIEEGDLVRVESDGKLQVQTLDSGPVH